MFRHTHVCIVSPCFVIVIDMLLFRLALGAEKKKKKKLFTTMLLVHFFHWTFLTLTLRFVTNRTTEMKMTKR